MAAVLIFLQAHCGAPKPGAGAPKPGAGVPKPGADAPKPGADAPKPGASVPKPGADAPKPGASAPKPGADAPKPGASAPKPGADAPKPGAGVPKPGADAPKPGADASKPGADASKPGASPRLARPYLWGMKKLLLLPLAAAFGLVSLGALPGCGAKGTEAAAPAAQAHALEDSLMAHHELAMSQTEQLFALKAQLTAAKVPANAPVLSKMQAADHAMMTWMHQYQAPDSTAPAPQRLAYLQDQQKQLTAIEQQLRTTLDSAQATLRRATPPAAAPAPAAPQPK